MPSEKMARLNELSRSRGFRNYYEERKLSHNVNLGAVEARAYFSHFLKAQNTTRNKASLEKFKQVREKLHINIEGDGTREVNYHGRKMSWDQFAVRRGIFKAKLTKAGREAGARLPSRRFDPGEFYDEDQIEEYYDVDFEETYDEYWFG